MNLNGIWALKPYYLRPWTLRVGEYVGIITGDTRS